MMKLNFSIESILADKKHNIEVQSKTVKLDTYVPRSIPRNAAGDKPFVKTNIPIKKYGFDGKTFGRVYDDFAERKPQQAQRTKSSQRQLSAHNLPMSCLRVNDAVSQPLSHYQPISFYSPPSTSLPVPIKGKEGCHISFQPHQRVAINDKLLETSSTLDRSAFERVRDSFEEIEVRVTSTHRADVSTRSNNSVSDRSDLGIQKSKTRKSTGNPRVGRKLFDGLQILEMEKMFSIKPYLTREERVQLSSKVDLTECQIKTWFQNRRTKQKRRGTCSEGDSVDIPDDITPNQPYRPKLVRVPGHGIQSQSTYGPPDRYLRAAIIDFLQRRPDSVKPSNLCLI